VCVNLWLGMPYHTVHTLSCDVTKVGTSTLWLTPHTEFRLDGLRHVEAMKIERRNSVQVALWIVS